MIESYITVNRALRALSVAIRETAEADRAGDGTGVAASFVNRALSDLDHCWPEGVDRSQFDEVILKWKNWNYQALYEILDGLLPRIEDAVDAFFREQPSADIRHSILDLLHPRVIAGAYGHFKAGRYRDAVFKRHRNRI